MTQQQRVGKTATKIRVNEQGETEIVYHSTAVVVFNDEKITLNDGGWSTPTTKTRMNQVSNQYKLGYRVYSKDWLWYVDYCGKTIPFTYKPLYCGERWPFTNATLSLKR